MVAEHGKWSIVTHRCCRLLPLSSHWNDGTVDVFLAKSKFEFVASQVLDAILHLSPTAQFLQLNTVGVQPLAVRMSGGKAFLDLTIIIYLAFLSINQEDLTRLEASLLSNLSWVEVHHTHLGCHYHHIVLGDGVAGRAQTITVEHTTGKAAIAEEQSSRTIPWLHQDRVILIECL